MFFNKKFTLIGIDLYLFETNSPYYIIWGDAFLKYSCPAYQNKFIGFVLSILFSILFLFGASLNTLY